MSGLRERRAGASASSSEHLKAPLAVDSEESRASGGQEEYESRSDHADVGQGGVDCFLQ
jgi:hypothetical protein